MKLLHIFTAMGPNKCVEGFEIKRDMLQTDLQNNDVDEGEPAAVPAS
jgi:hypothetical protein